MVLLREALESYMAPEVATSVLFDALERAGGPPPGSLEAARSFARGALADAVRGRVEAKEASEIIHDIDQLFDRAIEGDGVTLDVEVDLTLASDAGGGEGGTSTHVMQVVRSPVPVVVLSEGALFAEKLVICLGEDRVATASVSTEAGLRKTVFAHAPLLVLIDAVSPAAIEAAALCSAIKALPTNALPILWGSQSAWARSVLPALDAAGTRVLTIDRDEGIEPLLDLILSRYRGDS